MVPDNYLLADAHIPPCCALGFSSFASLRDRVPDIPRVGGFRLADSQSYKSRLGTVSRPQQEIDL